MFESFFFPLETAINFSIVLLAAHGEIAETAIIETSHLENKNLFR